jgi:hypothetical protein
VRRAVLTAWAATVQPRGLVKVTIWELRDPAGLARALRADGVPVNVQFISHPFTVTTGNEQVPSSCRLPQMSNKANALLQASIMPSGPSGPPVPGTARHSTSNGLSPSSDVYKNANPGVVPYIRPSAIPRGIGLSIAAWAAAPGTHNGTVLDLEADLVQTSPRCTGS